VGGIFNPSQYCPWKYCAVSILKLLLEGALKKVEKNIIINRLDNLLGR